MTRANINFVYQRKGHKASTLYFYQNGDQYPRGLRDIYHVGDFLKVEWTPEAFREWLGKNYKMEGRRTLRFANGLTIDEHVELETPAKPRNVSKPYIYDDAYGNIADYSYVFNSIDTTVQAYWWEKLVFSGTPKKFAGWLKKQK